jgi:Family of unknown function (DUF6918)
MKSLKEIMQDPNVSRSVVTDGIRVLDEEVGKRSGLGGLAIKGAYKVIKNVQGGRTLERAVEILMPEFIDKLDPYYEAYQKQGKGKTWSEYLRPHYDAVAEQLLAVTDRKIRGTDNRAIRGTYDKLRPKARKEVIASLPALTRMMERYL